MMTELLTREDQGAAATLVLYPSCRSKRYGRQVPNSTLVYSKEQSA